MTTATIELAIELADAIDKQVVLTTTVGDLSDLPPTITTHKGTLRFSAFTGYRIQPGRFYSDSYAIGVEYVTSVEVVA